MIDEAVLYQFFDEIPGDGRSLYIDTFVTICWMHKQGKTAAAMKLLKDMLNRINRLSDSDQSELIEELINTLPGNEKAYAKSVPMRAEFRSLFAD